MTWHSVDSQSDLDTLSRSVCWEDSPSIAYFATETRRAFYPTDICYDGHFPRKNLHLICAAGSPHGEFLELVFVAAERFDSGFLDQPYIQGRVDSLRRVVITDGNGDSVMRCARLLYRFSAERPAWPFESETKESS